jgi:nucleoside phosphorylase
MADMICHKVYEFLMSILSVYTSILHVCTYSRRPFCTILLFCGYANEEQGIFSLLFKYPYIQADFTVCVAQMIPGK